MRNVEEMKKTRRYDFKDFLNEKFDGNPKKVLDKYTYPKATPLFERLEKRQKGEFKELRNILNAIVLWKTKRMISLDDFFFLFIQYLVRSFNFGNILQ